MNNHNTNPKEATKPLFQNKTNLLTFVVMPAIVGILVGIGLLFLVHPTENNCCGVSYLGLTPGIKHPTISQEMEWIDTINKEGNGQIHAGIWSSPDTFYVIAKHGNGLITPGMLRVNQQFLGVHVLGASYDNWYPDIGTPNYDVVVFQLH